MNDTKESTVEVDMLDEGIDIREPRVYEVGYLLVPHIKEEDLDLEIDAIRKMITDQGGLPISEGRAELIELGYPMTTTLANEKVTFTKGYFGWIKFDVSPEKIAEIQEHLDASSKLIRFLLVATVREDTMVGAKLLGADEKKDKKPVKATHTPKAEEQPAGPIDEDKLDKQIDELVVEE